MLASMRIYVVLALVACGSKKSEPTPTSDPTPSATASASATAAFVDVTVVPMAYSTDPKARDEIPHQTVLVDGDRVVAMGDTDKVTVPANATKIDGAGKWLIPGLADMHVHFNDPNDALLYVANGVTSVRNMWGNPQTLDLRARARKNDPTYIGPSIVTAGPIIDGTPPIWPGSDVVDTPEQAVAEVAAQKKAGYDFLKVYDNLPLAAYDALAAEAAKQKMLFAGHVPAAVPLAHALDQHQASIEHLTGYLLAAQDASSKATTLKGPAQRLESAQHIDESKFAALAKATADHDAWDCPTLTVLSRFADLEHPDELAARPENKYVSPPTRAIWDPKQDFRTRAMPAAAFESMRKANVSRHKLVKALSDAGVHILAGTDTPNPFVVPGFSLHEELDRLVAAGLTPKQALSAATNDAGKWLANAGGDSIGSIHASRDQGSRADLVLLDADPLKDITATKKRAGVMLRGRWFMQKDLDARLEQLAKSYTEGGTGFAAMPALEIDPNAELVYKASYKMTFGGAEVGRERLAITRGKDGARTFTAQFAGQPQSVTMKLVVDKEGELVSLAIDEDGKHAELTRAGDHLHVVSPSKTFDEPFAKGQMLDTNLIAAMIAFADRGLAGKPGAPTKVVGKAITMTGDLRLDDIAYTFTRDATKVAKFSVGGGMGSQDGTYEVDDKGYPVAISVKAGPGEIVVKRE
jgi:imidazolonepropionase-like amidohydrolase